MSRFQKGSDGKYHVNGKPYIHLIGSRKQVWMGSAYKTDGQLVKNDLIMNKHRRIVSKKKHATAKKEKRLIKAGYGTKKGKFGFVLLGENKSKSRSRKQKGGVGGGGTTDNKPDHTSDKPIDPATLPVAYNPPGPHPSYPSPPPPRR